MLLFSGTFFVWISGQKVEASAKTQELQRQIADRQRSVDELKKKVESGKVEVKMTELTPEQTFQLAAARQLLERHNFSWNRLISDIEKYVPNEAKLSSIRIQEAGKSGESATAIVEIKAIGKTAVQMTEMMSKLENSRGLFAVDQASQEAIDDAGLVPFTLKLIYSPARAGEEREEQ